MLPVSRYSVIDDPRQFISRSKNTLGGSRIYIVNSRYISNPITQLSVLSFTDRNRCRVGIFNSLEICDFSPISRRVTIFAGRRYFPFLFRSVIASFRTTNSLSRAVKSFDFSALFFFLRPGDILTSLPTLSRPPLFLFFAVPSSSYPSTPL